MRLFSLLIYLFLTCLCMCTYIYIHTYIPFKSKQITALGFVKRRFARWQITGLFRQGCSVQPAWVGAQGLSRAGRKANPGRRIWCKRLACNVPKQPAELASDQVHCQEGRGRIGARSAPPGRAGPGPAGPGRERQRRRFPPASGSLRAATALLVLEHSGAPKIITAASPFFPHQTKPKRNKTNQNHPGYLLQLQLT